jgi:hypothetical protein
VTLKEFEDEGKRFGAMNHVVVDEMVEIEWLEQRRSCCKRNVCRKLTCQSKIKIRDHGIRNVPPGAKVRKQL